MSAEMAFAEEWLCNRLSLCELSVGAVKQRGQDTDLRESVFSTKTCPLPTYQGGSVLSTLEVYTKALRHAGNGHTAILDQGPLQPEPSQAMGAKEASIDGFALSLAEDILQSARSQWGRTRPGGSQAREQGVQSPSDVSSGDPVRIRQRGVSSCGFKGDPDELSCTILMSALEEVAGKRVSSRHRAKSAPDPRGQVTWATGVESGVGLMAMSQSCNRRKLTQDQSEASREADLLGEGVLSQGTWSPRGTGGSRSSPWFYSNSPTKSQSPFSILGHTGLPSKGSLDYPDAPPTTPLLPEMLRSQSSFTRKLKGGLAKEFLPSPPPPTPKNPLGLPEGEEPNPGDERADFMARLMRSLSLECAQQEEEEETADSGGTEGIGTQERSRLLAYAAQLSAEIVSEATTSCTVCKREVSVRDPGMKTPAPAKCLQVVAEQWVDEIIEASLLELLTEEGKGQAGNKHLTKQPVDPMLATTDSCGPKDLTPPGPAPSIKSSLWDGNHTPDASWTNGLSALAERLTTEALQQAIAELGKLPTLHRREPYTVLELAEELCDDIVAQAIATVTRQQSSRQRRGHGQGRSRSLSGPVAKTVDFKPSCSGRSPIHERLPVSKITVLLDEQACAGVQELQGALLWAAASKTGASSLRLEVPDVQLQTQFAMVANSALRIGWKVGDLVTSLLQYCELEEHSASRGRRLDRTSLLKHLHKKLGEVTN